MAALSLVLQTSYCVSTGGNRGSTAGGLSALRDPTRSCHGFVSHQPCTLSQLLSYSVPQFLLQ